MAGRQRLLQQSLRRLWVIGNQTLDPQLARAGTIERSVPLGGRAVDEVLAVQVQAVKEHRRHRHRCRAAGCTAGRSRLAAEAADRLLKGERRSVGAKGNGLAIEDYRLHVQLRRRRCHLGQGGGDVAEVAGEHAYLLPLAVHLNARTVQLDLYRRLSGSGQRVGAAVGRLSQHRLQRRQDL